MLENRSTQDPLPFGTFGIVGIGKYARFYHLPNNASVLQDHSGGARLLHIADDAVAIERTFSRIKTEIEAGLQ